MINLLPPKEKRNLLEEERMKLVFVLAVMLLIFSVSLLLSLVLVNVGIKSALDEQQILLDAKQQDYDKTDMEKLKGEIRKNNQLVLGLENFFEEKINMSDFLQKISALLPEAISLRQISISKIEKEGNFQVNLSGHANSIDDLIDLRELLKDDPAFGNINFPDSLWAQTADINFNINFTVTVKNGS